MLEGTPRKMLLCVFAIIFVDDVGRLTGHTTASFVVQSVIFVALLIAYLVGSRSSP